ncbi:helix-hairpin-helix domain-containing protein [Candidatus Woesebacteria bacterium]|nr:helix-hairpin-helix domain-containing protein [Candidatus Woesebacteria bacterium]
MDYISYLKAEILPSLKKYKVEVVLISISLIITIVLTIEHFIPARAANINGVQMSSQDVLGATEETPKPTTAASEENKKPTIFVEVSGAVLNPDVYELPIDARLVDVIDMAGGLSRTADSLFVARNYNLAKKLNDQEKIYIPYYSDIASGMFVEETRVLDYLQPVGTVQNNIQTVSSDNQNGQEKTISINTASESELDTLPGVGAVTAQKIIDNRPYASFDELLTKDVVKTSVFEDIQDMIEL